MRKDILDDKEPGDKLYPCELPLDSVCLIFSGVSTMLRNSEQYIDPFDARHTSISAFTFSAQSHPGIMTGKESMNRMNQYLKVACQDIITE